ncbi:hypothetical protein [Streptomyces sp. NBC_00872]|uniref:hypothetical protein n=1 Tax=Streptomyces sp. NBC_00872 TaxID=2903686 RepID=UPI002F90AA6C|nr:hypothetical protein OG214_37920 [Streptomyces sp. NBC_00872]
MLATILAVAGTLLGAVVTGAIQYLSAGRTARAARQQTLWDTRLDAVTTLAAAVSEHRRAMWNRGEAVAKREPDTRIQELKAQSRVTRSAIDRPLNVLRVLVTDPAVRSAADAMVSATYAMRQAHTSLDTLTQARETAVRAYDTFIDTAAAYLAAH